MAGSAVQPIGSLQKKWDWSPLVPGVKAGGKYDPITIFQHQFNVIVCDHEGNSSKIGDMV